MAEKKKRKSRDQAEEEAILHAPKVLETSLEDILADRFSRYSKYIIQERALPDARDGLKPVQRRILWAMYEDGNTCNKPYRKSAKTVGNVIGNYHPHGDSSVYDALVRMSQNWKAQLPLVDMQGNNGSIDDDPAAAMRYTEARLSKISEYLMEDIDKDTVEWAPNFSDDKMEPTVLPARYPNLLINGITGIAAGYATNIPPHNFSEVIEGTIYRIAHPDCSLDELMEIVRGPDFPTGGIVMSREGIRSAFETGRGRILIRSKCEIEETKTLNRIVVTEIPYEVVKSALVRKIDEIRLDRKAEGILDVRDESDRTGLRIVVDLKKEANAQAILNYLYKNTDLQISYHYNVVAIVNRTPRQLGLAAMLDAFIVHREQVIVSRSKYLLAQKQKRSHIVEGLIRALSVLDEIIALIRASKNKADSKRALMERFAFSDAQAEAIVTLQLYRLSNTDVEELKKEAAELASQIAQLEEVLNNEKKRRKLMIDELRKLEKEFDTPRRSMLQDHIEELVIDQRAMIADEQTMAAVSRQGYLKRVSMRSYNTSSGIPCGRREGDVMVGWAAASTLDTLVIFTDFGRYAQIPVYKIEEARWKDAGSHMGTWFKTEPGERITAAFLQSEAPKDLCLLMASRFGQIKRMHIEDLPAVKGARMQTVMKLAESDRMLGPVIAADPRSQLMLLSKEGLILRYDAAQIPMQQARTKGVAGMKLSAEDEIAEILIPSGDEIILENSEGAFKRISFEEIPLLKRPAKGVHAFKPVKSRPLTIAAAGDGGQILLDADAGLTLNTMEIPKMSLASTWSGTRALDQPAPVIRPLEKLKNGTWDLKTELEEEKKEEDEQLKLFDL